MKSPGFPQIQPELPTVSRNPVARFLAWIHSHPRWGWAGLMVYAAIASFPHENVQWEVNQLAIRISLPSLYRLSATIALSLGAILTLLLLLRLARQQQLRLVAALWFLTIALIFVAWRTLTANNVELVHYPQYFPEGMALAALTLSPAEALSWIIVFGGLDESYQYWVLSRGRPSLLDFNDIYMDLLGGAAGMVFAMAFLRRARSSDSRQWIRQWKRPGVRVILSLVAAGVLLWALGLMLVVEDKTNLHYWFALGRFRAPTFWAQIVANGPNRYHTLTPVEGVALIFFTIALYAMLCRRYIWKAGGRSESVESTTESKQNH